MEKLKELFKKYRQPILYVIFGGLTTLVNYVIYIILRLTGINMYITNTVAWIGAVLFAYFTNRGIVFNSQSRGFGERIRELGAFYAARIFSYAVEMLLMYILVTVMNLNEFVMKLIVQVIVIVLNYIFSKFFVFADKNKD